MTRVMPSSSDTDDFAPSNADAGYRASQGDTLRVRDLDLNLLKTFHAVSIEKHVGRAALRLGVTQPSVSHALSRLRLMFRDALFVRTAGGVEPTPRAQRLATSIEKALDILQDVFDEDAQFFPSSARRIFRLHMSDFAETAFLPTLLRELDRRAPGVVIETLHVDESQFNDALESGRIDFALGHFPHASEHFHRSELLHERYMLLMPRRVADRLGLDANFVLERNAPDALRFISITSHPRSMALLERHHLTSRIRAAVPDFMVVPAILQRCDYALILPRTVAQAFSAPGETASFEIADAIMWSVNAYWHRRFDADPGHRWLRALLMELFRIGSREPFDSWLAVPPDIDA